MKYIIPFILAATLAVAAPTNFTIPDLSPRDEFSGSINWFSRYDCRNPCVEDGMCASGQTGTGDLGSDEGLLSWTSGCWDRPAGAHSVSVAVDDGHKFTALSVSCDEFDSNGYKADEYQLPTADSGSGGTCTQLAHHKWKSVMYDW